MGVRWNRFGFQLHKILWVVLLFHLRLNRCFSLNLEGCMLLKFRSAVEIDPYGILKSWNPMDEDPCRWSGIQCTDGRVTTLDLQGLSLSGILVPELGKLRHLKALILYKNNISGVIPEDIFRLNMLEILDLRSNRLTGKIPEDFNQMPALRHLLLCNNSFHEGLPSWLGKFSMLCESQADQVPAISPSSRSCWHCIWGRMFHHLKKPMLSFLLSKGTSPQLIDMFLMHGSDISCDYKKRHGENLWSPGDALVLENEQHYAYSARRTLLQEGSNLPAAAAAADGTLQETIVVVPVASGSFPAVQFPYSKKGKSEQTAAPSPAPAAAPAPVALAHIAPIAPIKPILSTASANKPDNILNSQSGGTKRRWAYVLIFPGVVFILMIAAGMFLLYRTHGRPAIGPWKTGLSGQLQKAFISGIPKINRAELEAACEDFSNIIQTLPDCTIFKGTLSSGVEIAVVSTTISSSKDWTKNSEMIFQKKIDTFSRVNHKNFVNLLGYCQEDEPFMRMMVLEYAPNGTLFEHLHVEGCEHLDWGVRMRITMGITYCLEYMHHEFKPPVVHPNLLSHAVFLTDDYATKIADVGFWKEFIGKEKISEEDGTAIPESPSTNPTDNIYDFGILLLEVISGRHPYSEEHGSILNWAVEYLNDKHNFRCMVDPTLKSFNNSELDIICEVIQDCIHQDPKTRPTMKEITTKLREVIPISPESATPRLSPLWWAELEILSVEAS